jgi:hypothetical protein
VVNLLEGFILFCMAICAVLYALVFAGVFS